ncbi:helicase [Puccinia graminis f. sp. tritici]|uniref:Helicase n=1 Tax=Puccinia graminis f. sp. tritici TaxID=56615 RepID=A0A5B0QCG1_PUCGR|nr:helicase [Puccinia graminis f. sp. tritici]
MKEKQQNPDLIPIRKEKPAIPPPSTTAEVIDLDEIETSQGGAIYEKRSQTQGSAVSHPPANNFFSLALYQPTPEINSIQAEIRHYLKEDVKTKDIQVLPYWATQQKSFPKLSLMARRYLSIPATSAALEHIFSTGCLMAAIISQAHDNQESAVLDELVPGL